MPRQSQAAHFGQRIRQLRVDRELTLREFARLLDLSPTYISQVEQCKFSPPTEERVRQMAVLLQQDSDELLALAGHVSGDLPEIIRAQPREMASFLRAARGLSADDLRQLERQAKRLQTKKAQHHEIDCPESSVSDIEDN
ncbi:MAG: helix-turn-helix transcriptional regulator [Planctomycetaceae bacterium]|nr:helix-turn-helix transcriptional regulator [Planctomycetaceae bacterium]